MRTISFFLFVIFAFVTSEIYYQDNFDFGIDNWVSSDWKGSLAGKVEWSSGDIVSDDHLESKGMRTTESNKFYTLSSKFDQPFSNLDKTLVIQYSVKIEQTIQCGGAYIKLYPEDFDQDHLDGDEVYNIMFGPDICGGKENRKVQVILHRGGKNFPIKKPILIDVDKLPHLYTLILYPDNTYEVRIDGEVKQKGNIAEDFEIRTPLEIFDPNVKKPSNWVTKKEIIDPEDKKPEGWDDIPPKIPDPKSVKPSDWDDALDGVWKPKMINNPEFKGKWRPRKIPNPDYKGEWVHPKIPNPDYIPEDELYGFDQFSAIGIEVWQVKPGSVFDDFLITDSIEESEFFVSDFLKKQEGEKKKSPPSPNEGKTGEEIAAQKLKELEQGFDDDDDDEDDYDEEEKAILKKARKIEKRKRRKGRKGNFNGLDDVAKIEAMYGRPRKDEL